MRSLRDRFTGEVSWTAALIRAVLVSATVLSMIDVISVVTLISAQRKPACGDTCPRCLCKQHSVPAGLRSPCPCCSSRQPGMSGLSPLPPAVMPDLAREIRSSSPGELPCGPVAVEPVYAPAVPHPPPRLLLFS